MFSIRDYRWGWAVVGLLLCFLVWGGADAISIASSGERETFPTSQISARRAPGVSRVSDLVGVQATQTPTPETRTYVVEPGDSLWTIAIKFYGNGARYILIQQANNLPPHTVLRAGQVLVIPMVDTDKTPALAVQTPSGVTLSPTPEMLSPTPIVVPSTLPSAIPSMLPTVVVAPDPAPESEAKSNPSIAPIFTIVSIILNVLGAICFLGSLLCASLSYDLYQRSRRFARRKYISDRVHAGL